MGLYVIVEPILCMIGGGGSTLVLVMQYSVYEELLAAVLVDAVSLGTASHN